MDDREVVGAIMAGDPAGLAAAYDKYAAPLYGYCQWMLREPAVAADALQVTFIIAGGQLDALSDASQLRSWLYTVARDECYRRLSVTGEAFGDVAVPDERPADASAAQRAEVRRLIRATLAGLKPGDREVIELTLRQGLDDSELAAVLGVSWSRAHAHASHARAQLERTLGALLIARTAQQSCPALGVLLTGWDGRLTVPTADRVSRHVDECPTCAGRRPGGIRPEVLAGLLPPAPLPPGLREPVLRRWRDQALRHVGPAPDLADGLAPSGADGPQLVPSAAAESLQLVPSAAADDLQLVPSAAADDLQLVPAAGSPPPTEALPASAPEYVSAVGLTRWARIKRNPGRATTFAALALWIVAAFSATLITLTGLHTVGALASDTHTRGAATSVPAISSGSSSATAGAPSSGKAQPSAQPSASADGLAPASTPSGSVSPSKKARPSPSDSASATGSASASASASVSPSASPTTVHTTRPTPSPTPTPTPSPTPSATPT
jgi:RNA polymerase sigma factor (sigma-70 family)